jgi:hypothetical protein
VIRCIPGPSLALDSRALVLRPADDPAPNYNFVILDL